MIKILMIIYAICELINIIRYNIITYNISVKTRNKKDIFKLYGKNTIVDYIRNIKKCILEDRTFIEFIECIHNNDRFNIKKIATSLLKYTYCHNKYYDKIENTIRNKLKSANYENYDNNINNETLFEPHDEKHTSIYMPLIVNIVYTIINLVGCFYKRKIFVSTVRKHSIIYVNKNYDNNKKTIIFFHGIGVGITPYIKYINYLIKNGYNVIAPEIKFMSNRPMSIIPFDISELYNELNDELHSKTYSNIILMSHSYGSVMHSFFVIHNNKIKIEKNIMIEPIIIPSGMHNIINIIKWTSLYNIMKTFIKGECKLLLFLPDAQYAIKRYVNTYYSSMCFNKYNNYHIIISKNDNVIDYKSSKLWLDMRGIKTTVIDSRHGDFVHDTNLMSKIFNESIN